MAGQPGSADLDYEYAKRLQKQFEDEDPRHLGPSLTASSSSACPTDTALYPEFIQNDLDEVQSMTSETMSTVCYRCKSELMRDFSVSRWYMGWAEGQKSGEQPSICALECSRPKCRATTCLGCGNKAIRSKNITEVGDLKVDWCCESGQLFAIWCLLCRQDEQELEFLSETDEKIKQSQTERAQYGSTTSKGTGYGGGLLYFTGTVNPFGGYEHGDNSATKHSNTHRLDFKPTNSDMDKATKHVFDLITRILPLSKGKAAPRGLFEMIELSLFQERAAQLLRNDSLEDVYKRGSLYRSLFAFVTKVGEHPDTRLLVTDSRFAKRKSPGLMELSIANLKSSRGQRNGKGKLGGNVAHSLEVDQSEDSMSSSLLDSMKNLSVQSIALLKTGKAVKSGFDDADGQQMLEMAKRISSLHRLLTESKKENDGSKTRSVSRSDQWTAYHVEHRVTHHANQVMANLRTDLQSRARAILDSPRGRLKALALQTADLHTSLPPGIFVKVAENRPDTMKFLIVGPEDTPYAGGLFEFDLLCLREFPYKPPICVFRTTANGQSSGPVRFNPNLHKDGKVCLSLLGTWPGNADEQWQPGKSTILQVLVSIQAMIFSSTPFENEPGYGHAVDIPQGQHRSDSYNKTIQALTVRFAMLEWLQRADMRDGIWKQIVGKYFELNGEKMITNVRKWAETNKGITALNGIEVSRKFRVRSLLGDLEAALSGSAGK